MTFSSSLRLRLSLRLKYEKNHHRIPPLLAHSTARDKRPREMGRAHGTAVPGSRAPVERHHHPERLPARGVRIQPSRAQPHGRLPALGAAARDRLDAEPEAAAQLLLPGAHTQEQPLCTRTATEGMLAAAIYDR